MNQRHNEPRERAPRRRGPLAVRAVCALTVAALLTPIAPQALAQPDPDADVAPATPA